MSSGRKLLWAVSTSREVLVAMGGAGRIGEMLFQCKKHGNEGNPVENTLAVMASGIGLQIYDD